MERMVPISAVGMGVSQILPVLVQGLIAPPIDCLLLFQQPELHLHPALQEGLADFLLALAMSGRRVIVETHSEYLVSRLAHNLVDLDWGLDDPERYIGLVLVSQNTEDGTTYRATEIDPLGTINWPEGFFNESTTTALATLKAGLAKLERSESPDTPTGG
jgi:predicted ATPase